MILGLDIGGANLKWATSDGNAGSVPFALWKQPDDLAECLRWLPVPIRLARQVRITMTGELCDCFETKAEGVKHIVYACGSAYPEQDLLYWLVNEGWATPTEALDNPTATAASNWNLLADFVGQTWGIETGGLIDMGSTTTDIIPIRGRQSATIGQTDETRLKSRELLYLGTRRTPLGMIPAGWNICREFFATIQDVLIANHTLPEEPNSFETADERPATRIGSLARIARQLGGDRTTISEAELNDFCQAVCDFYRREIVNCVSEKIPEGPVVLSGSAEDWLAELLNSLPAERLVSFSGRFGATASSAACAWSAAFHTGIESEPTTGEPN